MTQVWPAVIAIPALVNKTIVCPRKLATIVCSVLKVRITALNHQDLPAAPASVIKLVRIVSILANNRKYC
jgi:hypothetical protein